MIAIRRAMPLFRAVFFGASRQPRLFRYAYYSALLLFLAQLRRRHPSRVTPPFYGVYAIADIAGCCHTSLPRDITPFIRHCHTDGAISYKTYHATHFDLMRDVC